MPLCTVWLIVLLGVNQNSGAFPLVRDAELEVLRQRVEVLTAKLSNKGKEVIDLRSDNEHLVSRMKEQTDRLDTLSNQLAGKRPVSRRQPSVLLA